MLQPDAGPKRKRRSRGRGRRRAADGAAPAASGESPEQ
jgi:hypothetical protein